MGVQPDYYAGLDLGQAMDFSALCLLQHMPDKTYECRGLKRWPLGTAYPQIVAETCAIINGLRPERGCSLVVDASGCGRPVVDLIRQARPAARLNPVTITAGSTESWDAYARMWHVSKICVVSALQVVLQSKRLRLPADNPLTGTLLRELSSYRVKVTANANETFNAREGEHDDLVLAVALAVWHAEKPPIMCSAG